MATKALPEAIIYVYINLNSLKLICRANIQGTYNDNGKMCPEENDYYPCLNQSSSKRQLRIQSVPQKKHVSITKVNNV
jgi:hypothetical protein